jgi:hypothetical protein
MELSGLKNLAMEHLEAQEQNWFVFLVAAQGIMTALVHRRKSFRYVVVYALLFLSYLPWVNILLHQANQEDFGLSAPLSRHIFNGVGAFTGSDVRSGHSWVRPWSVFRPCLWASFLFWTWFYVRKRPFALREQLYLVSFIGPLALAIGVSVVHVSIINAGRHTMIMVPALFLLVAELFQNERRRQDWLKLSVPCVVAMWLTLIGAFLTTYEKAPWKNVKAWLDQQKNVNSELFLGGLPANDRVSLWYYTSDSRECFESEFVVALAKCDPANTMYMPVRDYEAEEQTKNLPSAWKVVSASPVGRVTVLTLRNKKFL